VRLIEEHAARGDVSPRRVEIGTQKAYLVARRPRVAVDDSVGVPGPMERGHRFDRRLRDRCARDGEQLAQRWIVVLGRDGRCSELPRPGKLLRLLGELALVKRQTTRADGEDKEDGRPGEE